MIDSTFYNHAAILSGSATSVDSGIPASNSAGVIDITYTSNNPNFPLVGFRANSYVAILWVRKSNNTYNIRLVTKTVGEYVTYYIFDRPTAISNAGMQIFDSNGVLTFDADRNYLRITDIVNRTNGDLSAQALSSSDNRCVIMTSPKISRITINRAPPAGARWQQEQRLEVVGFQLMNNAVMMDNVTYVRNIITGNTGSAPIAPPDVSSKRFTALISQI